MWGCHLFPGYWVEPLATLPTLVLLRDQDALTLAFNFLVVLMLVAWMTATINFIKPSLWSLNCLDG